MDELIQKIQFSPRAAKDIRESLMAKLIKYSAANQAAVTGSTLRYGWNDVTRKACETARQEEAA